MVDIRDIKEQVLQILDAEGEIAAVNYLKEHQNLSTSEAMKIVQSIPDYIRPVVANDEIRPAHQTKPNTSSAGKYIGIFFMACGIPFLAYVGYKIYDEIQFGKRAITVEGRVIDFDESETYDSENGYETMYSPIFEYSYQGVVYKETGNISSSGRDYDENELVEILIDPDRPAKVMVNTFTERWLFSLIFLVMGLAFTGMGFMAYKLF